MSIHFLSLSLSRSWSHWDGSGRSLPAVALNKEWHVLSALDVVDAGITLLSCHLMMSRWGISGIFLCPSRLGNVDCKLEMNSSTCCRGCFFTLLNIILPFWKAFELRFSLELLMPSHYLRMLSRAWQWRRPAASVREDRTCWRSRHLCHCCIYAVCKQTEM